MVPNFAPNCEGDSQVADRRGANPAAQLARCASAKKHEHQQSRAAYANAECRGTGSCRLRSAWTAGAAVLRNLDGERPSPHEQTLPKFRLVNHETFRVR